LEGGRLGLGGRRHAVQQAERGRLVGADDAAGENEVLSAGHADQGRQPGRASLRLSPPTRRSAPEAISAPAPTQLPTQTAITGTGKASIAAYMRVKAAMRATPPSASSDSPMSAPAHSAVVLVVEMTSTR